ncbi:MAG: hypothetical protein AABZ53_06775 [Planctomycetota bacterium]
MALKAGDVAAEVLAGPPLLVDARAVLFVAGDALLALRGELFGPKELGGCEGRGDRGDQECDSGEE